MGTNKVKVALVHDWLTGYRGGEKVLEAISELFPTAPIYTLFFDKDALPPFFADKDIRYPRTLNRFRKFRQLCLPILPIYIESLPVSEYDLLISTSSCVAKGVIPGPTAKHICYIHSPMRYIWDQAEHYHKSFQKIPFSGQLLKLMTHRLRIWDTVSNNRVDSFVANSSFVANRVAKYYRRDAKIIHPPIDTKHFTKDNKTESDFYLAAGAFVPYKKFDLAIKACIKMKKKLVVAGNGPEKNQLMRLSNHNVEFKISPSNTELLKLMRNAKAFIFPGVEDFGMIAVEALSCGTPVIAYKGGGALDYVQDTQNGLLFEEQTVDSLANSINKFEKMHLDPGQIEKSASLFSKENFTAHFKKEVHRIIGAD